ncbi:MAG: hypothetical protein Q9169_000647 [Polycauliona sp. 2 TL-2023]
MAKKVVNEISDYERQRQENIAQRDKLLKQLALDASSAGLGPGQKPKPVKSTTTHRKKPPVKKVKEEIVPRRTSSRIAGIEADSEVAKRKAEDEHVAVQEAARVKRQRISGPLDLSEVQVTGKGWDKDANFFQSIADGGARNTLQRTFGEQEVKKTTDKELRALREKMSALELYDAYEPNRIKITPERIYSLGFHPVKEKPLVFAGDKMGNLGLFDASQQSTPSANYAGVKCEDQDEEEAEEDDPNPRIDSFHVHTRTISSFQFSPYNPSHVYTSSYDSSLRLLDLTKSSTVEIYAPTDTSLDEPISGVEMDPQTPHLLYFSRLDGHVGRADTRAPNQVDIFQLSEKKIGGFSLNPSCPHFIATASLDRTMRIWDLRKMSGKKGGQSPALCGQHESRLSVSHAAFNSAGQVATASYDDTIKIHTFPGMAGWSAGRDLTEKEMAPSAIIRHNNQTGRWVTILRAQWQLSPSDDVQRFCIGNMNRFVDIYTSQGDQLAQLGGDATAGSKYTPFNTSALGESSRSPSICTTFRTSPGPDAPLPRKRKRKRKTSDVLNDQPNLTSGPGIILPEASEKRHASSGFAGIRPPPLVYPKSLYTGQHPPFPPARERHVLKEILEEDEATSSGLAEDDFVSVNLEAFSIYRPHQVSARRESKIGSSGLKEKPRSGELVSLQDLHDRNPSFCFDGILRFGRDSQRTEYLQGVPFETLSIGGYEDTGLATVGPDIWLQSFAGKASGIWYRLQSPSAEYLRYHKPFIWLADLAKHVVDFMHTHDAIRLHHFKGDFAAWLATEHHLDDSFRSWRGVHPRTDFRQVVAAHATFLYNQAGQLGSGYISQPLWNEIDPAALTAVPRQISQRKDRGTVVTPYVYECFAHMPWAKFLDPVTSQDPRKGNPTSPTQQRQNPHARNTISEGAIQVGDIVAIPSDRNTDWKTEDQYWYAYVQYQKVTAKGQRLGLIWLYRPADTACQHMRYPHPQELFMSDHCNCEDAEIYTSEVAHKVRVTLFGDLQATHADFFIRQKYHSGDSFWTTLQISDFRCQCGREQELPRQIYSVGDTVLVQANPSDGTLEPVVLLEGSATQPTGKIRARRLVKKRTHYGDRSAAANELVYTSREVFYDVSAITRPCYVRFYTPHDRERGSIPAPYNRSGTGDCFYILWEESAEGDLEPLQQPSPVMNQGFDPLAAPSRKPLRGLDIFCGGGDLGRGLEESQAVKNEWAVDYFTEAIHTYHANTQRPTQLYNGSVNDYLYQAINARGAGKIAQQGQVEVIAAGSPCQGFSVANHRYTSNQSLLNISMVASVVAFVDFYRPKYVVMENVLGMANCGPKRAGQDNNVFAQVLCALVGLGYQVRPMILDAWNFGAPQGRTRLFISAAAPGLSPLARPPPSHCHPDTVIGRSLGKTANGLPFGSREWEPTPFEYVTMGEATEDLPENVDARTACIPYPDHRVTGKLSALDEVRLRCVPRFPPGMTFVKSAQQGRQPPPQMAAWHWDTEIRGSIKSMAYQRALSNALLPTLTTKSSPAEALTGSALHWDAHRCLTIMEARRAQGYPDDEVIIGAPSMQWKILGNSVARPVATALGVSLRAAFLANESNGEPPSDVTVRGNAEPPCDRTHSAQDFQASRNGVDDLADLARAGKRLHGHMEIRVPMKDGNTASLSFEVDSNSSA